MATASTPFQPLLPDLGVQALLASYRRGRWLVLALVLSMCAYSLMNDLHGYLTGGTPAKLSDLMGGWVMVGFVGWCVFRGGSLARGCMIFFCTLMVGGLVLTVGSGNYRDAGRDGWAMLRFLPVSIWAVYGFWVLLVSKDARRYMQLRRREITSAESLAFEWKQDQRRQERSEHAS